MSKCACISEKPWLVLEREE